MVPLRSPTWHLLGARLIDEMRILLATPQYVPELGGLTTVWSKVATALVRQGHQVTVVTQQPRSSHSPSSEICEGVTVHRFTERVGGERFGYAPSLRRWVRAEVKQFDLIHLVSFHAPIALALHRLATVPMVFSPTYHGGGHTPLANALHLVYQPMSRGIFKRADLIHCYSESEAQGVEHAFPLTHNKIRVIHAGFPTQQSPSAPPFDLGQPVLLVAGRLEAYKRVDLIIDALQYLKSDVRLVVCGAGPQERELRERSQQSSQAQSVDFVGYVSDEELCRWQRSATVALSASTDESFGLGLAEAASAGARVVATDLPAHREVAQLLGVEMAFFPVTISPRKLANMIDLAVNAGRQDASAVRVRTWDDVAADFDLVYRDLVRRTKP